MKDSKRFALASKAVCCAAENQSVDSSSTPIGRFIAQVPLECETCGAVFSTKQRLALHCFKSHGIKRCVRQNSTRGKG
eukprot:10841376-Karenia_brevis.AAC.1